MRKFFLLGVGVGFIISGILFSVLHNKIPEKKSLTITQKNIDDLEMQQNQLPEDDSQVYDLPPDIKPENDKNVKSEYIENARVVNKANLNIEKPKEYLKSDKKINNKIEIEKRNIREEKKTKINLGRDTKEPENSMKKENLINNAANLTTLPPEETKMKEEAKNTGISKNEIVRENKVEEMAKNVNPPLLKDNNVEKSNGRYYLQLATYKSYSFGEKLVNEMKNDNIKAKVVKKGTSYKVISEDITGYEESQKLLKVIEQKYKIKGISVKKQ